MALSLTLAIFGCRRKVPHQDKVAPIDSRRSTDGSCPKCGAEAGAPCRSLKTGRPVPYPHSGRRSPNGALNPAQLKNDKPKLRDAFSPSSVPQQTWLSILKNPRNDS
ncbi:zinc finger domain-containing protein [Ramlibacter algicola]|uniref:zinc finger domain-containing protein n=1 Tax=Ramlibacter algicola TaxID=2795217 RepID=UPI003B846ACE